MTFRTIARLSVVAIALVAAACGSSGSSTSSTSVPADAVGVVNGVPIPKATFDKLMASALATKGAQAPKPGSQEYETLKQQALNYLFEKTIVVTEAAKAGLKVDTKKIDAQEAQQKQQSGGDAKFAAQLKANHMTEADYRDTLSAQQLAQALFAKVSAGFAPVTDADIAARYARDKETVYKIPASRKVQHILLGLKGGATPKEADYAKLKVKAQDVIAQLDAGADFNALVKKYSTDTASIPNNGTYDVTPTGFDPAFTKASYALKTGKYTEQPVKSAFGYHVIKALADATKGGYKTLAEVKDQIKSELENERKNAQAAKWYDRIKASYAAQSAFAKGYSLPPAPTTGATTSGATTN
jgi:parvulin-like peptidyl-prolyl isomerase